MSRALRTTIAAILVAACASLAPSQALTLGRHAAGGPSRLVPARGFVAWLFQLFELATGDTGGGMDPNGNH